MGVSTIRIYNRGDKGQAQLDGINVFVGDTLCARNVQFTGGQMDADNSVLVKCNNAVGSTVKIVQPKSSDLSLCEVQVFGHMGSSVAHRRIPKQVRETVEVHSE